MNPTTWEYDASTPTPATPATRTVTSTVPFDYARYFASEPTLQAALEQIRQSRLTQGAQLVGGEQQLFGRLGEAPDLSAPQFANLPPALRTALQNAVTPELRGIIDESNRAGTSALARLQHDYNVTQSGDVGSLISRNMIRSGELGQRLNEDTRALTLGQYDARQRALDALGTLQQTYLTGQNELAGQAATAVSAAQERAGTLINAGLLGPTQQTRTVTNPYLNPAAPTQVSGGVRVGSTTSYEPKPTTGNIVPQTPKPRAAPYRAPSLGFKAAI